MPDFIKNKWKDEVSQSFRINEWELPSEPFEELLGKMEFVFVSYNGIPNGPTVEYNSLIKKSHTFFQKGVVVITGDLRKVR